MKLYHHLWSIIRHNHVHGCWMFHFQAKLNTFGKFALFYFKPHWIKELNQFIDLNWHHFRKLCNPLVKFWTTIISRLGLLIIRKIRRIWWEHRISEDFKVSMERLREVGFFFMRKKTGQRYMIPLTITYCKVFFLLNRKWWPTYLHLKKERHHYRPNYQRE